MARMKREGSCRVVMSPRKKERRGREGGREGEEEEVEKEGWEQWVCGGPRRGKEEGGREEERRERETRPEGVSSGWPTSQSR